MNYRHATHVHVPPIVDGGSHVLLLGSMLSPKSAEAKFYYAHPQNRFWKVISALFGEQHTPASNEERAMLALSNGIALWDIISECDIIGASDQSIKNVIYNDIAGLLLQYPSITRIYATGTKAFQLLCKYNKSEQNQIISRAGKLPSTSPLNCKASLDDLVTAYSVIKNKPLHK